MSKYRIFNGSMANGLKDYEIFLVIIFLREMFWMRIKFVDENMKKYHITHDGSLYLNGYIWIHMDMIYIYGYGCI